MFIDQLVQKCDFTAMFESTNVSNSGFRYSSLLFIYES